MAVGFATLGGGDTVSFDLNTQQTSALQSVLTSLNPSGSPDQVLTSFTATPNDTSPGFFNAYVIPAGEFATAPFVPPYANAMIADSTTGTQALSTDGTVGSDRATLWVGNQGNDTFSLAAPSQTVFAGDGNDSITVNSEFHGMGANFISVGSGSDTITLIGQGTVVAQDVAGSADQIDVEGYGSIGDSISVGDGNDTINVGQDPSFGPVTNATVTAGNGNDVINIRADNYVVNLGTGSDVVNTYGSGTININGGSATINAGAYTVGSGLSHGSALQLTGTGNVVFNGANDGFDTVTTGAGNATLNAGQGVDIGVDSFTGGSGNVLMDASASGPNEFAIFTGGSGSTTMEGGAGFNSFITGSGNATATGGSGQNYFNATFDQNGNLTTFDGGSGAMSMVGGSGPNYFYAGSGDDTMTTAGTNQARDYFNFQQGVSGDSTITGFSNGDAPNNLYFSGYGLTADAIAADAHVVGGDTVINLGATQITITDFTNPLDPTYMIHSA